MIIAADDSLELAHDTLVRRHELRGSMLPVLALAYNSKRQQLVACDESSIRLFSLRREVTVLWLDGPKPIAIEYLEAHDIYLVVYEEPPEFHPESSSAQILHASLAPLLRWRPHDTPTRCCSVIDATRFATSGGSELKFWRVAMAEDTGLFMTPTAIVAEQSVSVMHSRWGMLASASGTMVRIFTGLDHDHKQPTLIQSFDVAERVTCLQVITQNFVAAGCADGMVCIYDLAKQAELCEIRAHCSLVANQNSTFLSEDSTTLPDLDESTSQSRAPTTVAKDDVGVFALCANVLAIIDNQDSVTLELFTCGVAGSRCTTHWLISAADGRSIVQQLTTKLAPNEPPVRPDLENTVYRKHFKASIAASPMRARLCALQRRHCAPIKDRLLVTSHGGLITIYEVLEPEWRLATASDHIVQLHALGESSQDNAAAALTEGSRLETFYLNERQGLLSRAEPPASLLSAAVRDTTRRFPESFGRRTFNVLRGRAALSALTGPSADRVVFGPLGDSQLYACRSDGILEVFDLPSLKASTLDAHIPQPPITACCSCPQRKLLVVGDAGGTLHVVAEELKYSFQAHVQAIACIVAQAPNLIASASVDGVIKLWRLNSTKLVPVAHITISSSTISSLVLVTSSVGSNIAVVGLESGMLESAPAPAAAADGTENPLPLDERHQVVAHSMSVAVLDRAKQPQGDLVLSASLDRTMCLWQMINDKTGPTLLRFVSLAHPIYAAILVFLPDLSRNAVFSCVADGNKLNRVCLMGKDGGVKDNGGEQAIEHALETSNTVVRDEKSLNISASPSCVQTKLMSLEAHAPHLTAAFPMSRPPGTSPGRKKRASLSTKSLASSSSSSSVWLALPLQVGDRVPASECSLQSWPLAHQDRCCMLTSTTQQGQQTSHTVSDEEPTALPSAAELQAGDRRLRAAFEDRRLGTDDIAASSLGGLLRAWWGDVLSTEEASAIGKPAAARLDFAEVCEKAANLCRMRHRIPNSVSGSRIDRVRPATRIASRKKLSDMSRERVRVTYNIMGEAVTTTTIFSEDVAPGKGAVKNHRIESKQQRRRNVRCLSKKKGGGAFASRPVVLPDSLAPYFAEPQLEKLRQVRSQDGSPSDPVGQIASARLATMEVRKVFSILRSSKVSLAKTFYDLYRRSYGPRRVCEAKMVTLLDATADFGNEYAAVGAFGRFLGIAEDCVVSQRWAKLYVAAVDWFQDRSMLTPMDNGALLVTRRNAAACTSHLSGDSPVVASAAVSRVAAMPSLSSKEAACNFWDEPVDAEAVAEQLALECSEAEKITTEAARHLFEPNMLDAVLTPSGEGAAAATTADESSTSCGAKMAELLRNLLNRFVQRDRSRGGAISEEDFFEIARYSWPGADAATACKVATVFRDAYDQQIVYVDLWAMLYTEVFLLRRAAMPSLCDVYALALNQCVGIDDSLARCVQAYIAHVDFRATFAERQGAEADFTLLKLFPGDPVRVSSIRPANLDPGTMRIVSPPTVVSRQQRKPSSACAAYSPCQQYVPISQDNKSCVDETPSLRQVELTEEVKVKTSTPERATQLCSYSRSLCSLGDDRPPKLTSEGRGTTAGVLFSVVGSVGYRYVDDPFETDDNNASNGNPSSMVRSRQTQDPLVRQSVQAFAADSAIGQYSAIGRAAAPILPISSSESSQPGRWREEELAKNRTKVAAARSVRTERRRQLESLPEPDARHEEKMRRLEAEAARRGDAARQARAAAVAEREARAKADAEAAARARLEEIERQQQLETKQRLIAERKAESKRRAEEKKVLREREELRLAEARARADSKRRAFEAVRDARIRDEEIAKQKELLEDQQRRQRDNEAHERCTREGRLMHEEEQYGYALQRLRTREMHEAETRRRGALLAARAAQEAAECQEMNASEECGRIIRSQWTREDEVRAEEERYKVERLNQAQAEKEQQQAEIEGMRLEEQSERARLALIEVEADRRAAKTAELRRRLDGVGRRKEENEKSSVVARRSSLGKAVQHCALSVISGARTNATDVNSALRRNKQYARASNSAQLLVPLSRHDGHRLLAGESSSPLNSNTPPFFYICNFLFSEDLVYAPFDPEIRRRLGRRKPLDGDSDNEDENAALGGLEELPKAARGAIEAATTDILLKESLSQLYSDDSRNSDDIADVGKIDHVHKIDWSRLFAMHAKSLSASARDLCSFLLSSSNAYSTDKALTDAAKRKLAGDVPRPDTYDRVSVPAGTIQFLELGTVRTVRATSSRAVFAIDVPEGRPILTIVLSCIDRDANLLVCKARLPTRCNFDWADTSLKAVKRVVIWPTDPKHGAGQFVIVVEPATPYGATFSLFAICSGLCDSSVPSDELKRLEPRLRIFNKLHATCSIEQLLDDYSLAYETAKAAVARQLEVERTVSNGFRAGDMAIRQDGDLKSPLQNESSKVRRSTSNDEPEEALAFERLLYSCGKQHVDKAMIPGKPYRLNQKVLPRQKSRHRRRKSHVQPKDERPSDVADLDDRLRVLTVACSNSNLLNFARRELALPRPEANASKDNTAQLPSFLLRDPIQANYQLFLHPTISVLSRTTKRRLPYIVKATSAQ